MAGRRIRSYGPEDHAAIGARHGSPDVAKEAGLAAERWEHDQPLLSGYGHGAKVRKSFEDLRREHAKAIGDRPEAVAAKETTVRARDAAVSAGWAWVDRAESMLLPAARNDEALATDLTNALPEDDTELPTRIPALAAAIKKHSAVVDPDARPDDLLAEMEGVIQQLTSGPGAVQRAKAATKEDTREIDVLDGKLYVAITDLNRAARKALRNADQRERLGEYRLHVLKRSGSPRPAAAKDDKTGK